MSPVIRALTRHKLPVVLIVLEVAMACTVIINSLDLLAAHVGHVQVSAGVRDRDLGWLRSTGTTGRSVDSATVDGELLQLRGASAIKSAAMVSALPFTETAAYSFKVSESAPGIAETSGVTSGMYFWTREARETLGVPLIAGRDFLPQEFVNFSFFGKNPPPSVVMVTRSLALRIFGRADVVGRRLVLHMQGDPTATVVGVTGDLPPPSLRLRGDDLSQVIFPVTRVQGGLYVINADAGKIDQALASARSVLYTNDPSRILLNSESYASTVSSYFRSDRDMIWTLGLLAISLVALTTVGIVAISNYWVVQRRRSIGIRRALGAQRRHIVQYFLLENLALVALGAFLGTIGALVLNVALMHWFEVSMLSLGWLPLGFALLVLVGQAAVGVPALRASRISPAAIVNAE
jgi:putative ABC transport system permease protein